MLEGTWTWGRNGSEEVEGNDLLTSTWMRSSRLGCGMVRKGEVERLGEEREVGREIFIFSLMKRK